MNKVLTVFDLQKNAKYADVHILCKSAGTCLGENLSQKQLMRVWRKCYE